MIKNLFLILSIICFSNIAEAKDLLNVCIPLKSYTNNDEPAEFSKTNNLLRKSGIEPLYCGQKILLNLEVVDENCVPISDAKIYLWHLGCDKKYPYKPLRERVDHTMFQKAGNSTFLGSGVATTNNLGEAKFITISPPSTTEKAHFNIRIEDSHLGSFQTKIFLHDHELTEGDDYETLQIRIVTPWKNLFRRY